MALGVSYKPFTGSCYLSSLRLQKWLYLNAFIYPTWILVVTCFLYLKFPALGSLTRFLAVAVLIASLIIEVIRLYLGYYGNLSHQVPELAGFLMLTVLMQIPLLSFFLYNPYLNSTPTEVTLHSILWTMMVTEIFLGYFSLKQASAFAKSLYLSSGLKDK